MVSLSFGRLNKQTPKISTFILIVVIGAYQRRPPFRTKPLPSRHIEDVHISTNHHFRAYQRCLLSNSIHHNKGILGVKAASEKRYREYPSEFKYVPYLVLGISGKQLAYKKGTNESSNCRDSRLTNKVQITAKLVPKNRQEAFRRSHDVEDPIW